MKWSSDNRVMLCKWRDKSDIFLISTNDAGGDNEAEVRGGPHGPAAVPHGPAAVRMDQLRSAWTSCGPHGPTAVLMRKLGRSGHIFMYKTGPTGKEYVC